MCGGRCETDTNLAIEDELICAAKELGGHRTKKEAVTVALQEYVRRKRLDELLAYLGTMEDDDGLDFRELRNRDLRRVQDLLS